MSRQSTTTATASVSRLRVTAARVIWTVCVLAALVLALGALLIALDANRDNELVGFVLDLAGVLDLGVFSMENGIKEWRGGENAETKNALFNWGLGAVAWLVVGRILDKLVRP